MPGDPAGNTQEGPRPKERLHLRQVRLGSERALSPHRQHSPSAGSFPATTAAPPRSARRCQSPSRRGAPTHPAPGRPLKFRGMPGSDPPQGAAGPALRTARPRRGHGPARLGSARSPRPRRATCGHPRPRSPPRTPGLTEQDEQEEERQAARPLPAVPHAGRAARRLSLGCAGPAGPQRSSARPLAALRAHGAARPPRPAAPSGAANHRHKLSQRPPPPAGSGGGAGSGRAQPLPSGGSEAAGLGQRLAERGPASTALPWPPSPLLPHRGRRRAHVARESPGAGRAGPAGSAAWTAGIGSVGLGQRSVTRVRLPVPSLLPSVRTESPLVPKHRPSHRDHSCPPFRACAASKPGAGCAHRVPALARACPSSCGATLLMARVRRGREQTSYAPSTWWTRPSLPPPLPFFETRFLFPCPRSQLAQ